MLEKTQNLERTNLSGSIFIDKVLYQTFPGLPHILLVYQEQIGQCILYFPEEDDKYAFLSPISNYKLSKICEMPLTELLSFAFLIKLDSAFCFAIKDSWLVSIEDKENIFKGFFPMPGTCLRKSDEIIPLRKLIKDLNKDYVKTTKGNWYWEERGQDNNTITLFAQAEKLFDSEVFGTQYGHPANILNSQKLDWDSNGENNRNFIMNAKNTFALIQDLLWDLNYPICFDYQICCVNNVLKVLNI